MTEREGATDRSSTPEPGATPSDEPRHVAAPVLRDLLAADRTGLANERTLLAYVRTALGFVAAGAGLLYFSDVRALEIIGGLLILATVGTLLVGLIRYRRIARDLAAFRSGIGVSDEGTD